MKVIVNSKELDLTLIDPNTGICYATDFIGNHGALRDGQFRYCEDTHRYYSDKSTYEWWEKIISAQQDLEYRIKKLESEYGFDRVQDIIAYADDADLEYHACSVNNALDDAFGANSGL